MKKKWKKIGIYEFKVEKYLIYIFGMIFSILLVGYFLEKDIRFLRGMIVTLGIGVLCVTIIRHKNREIREKSNLMDNFIRMNGLYQSHSEVKNGLFYPREVEVIDYYPKVEYQKQGNIFYLRIRRDGNFIAEKFTKIEAPLSNMFFKECVDIIYKRGYVIYGFEIEEQKQIEIKSWKDIPRKEDGKVIFSESIVWEWKEVPHILITGITKSGKSMLVQYIISSLLEQGVRIIYCDPKKDNNMMAFAQDKPMVYVTKTSDIARVVRETEEELRKREKSLEEIRFKGADFPPIYLFFDEYISFSQIADAKTYEETKNRLSSIIVMGRGKQVFAGVIFQRADTKYIDGAIRENLCTKICMGQMSDTAYAMAFGNEFKDVKNYRREIGSGLIYSEGINTKPREFVVPFIHKGALDIMM